MPAFFPSCVVNLGVRFDEALQTAVPAPDSVTDLVNGDLLGGLGDTGVNVAANTAGLRTTPLFNAGQADQYSQIFGVVPRNGSFALNGFRQAWTFSLDVAFRDLPLDPRAIRALRVEIYLDAVQDTEWAKGMAPGGLTVNSMGRPSPAIPGKRTSVLTPSQDNQVMIGTADTISIEHGPNGQYVHIEGRDIRGLLLDIQLYPPMLKNLDLKKPIDQVLSQIAERHPLLKGGKLKIYAPPSEWTDGVPTLAVEGDLTRPNRGANGQSPTMQPQGDANQISFWELCIQYCYLVGAIPYFVGETLYIRPAPNIWAIKSQDKQFDPSKPATPFKGGKPREVATQSGNESFAYRRMIYGSNVQTLKFERKLSGVKVPTIVCYSIDTGNKKRGFKNRLVQAQWPAEGPGVISAKVAKAKVTNVSADGAVTQEDVKYIAVPGIASKDRLQQIAKAIREEVGRGEMGGSCSTKDLASFGGTNVDPDLLRTRPGDAVEFRAAANGVTGIPPIVSELSNQAGMSQEELTSYIQTRIGNADIARVMAATLRGSVPQIQRTFRTGNVRYSWDKDSGVGIDFDFQNYVEARYDVTTTTSTTAPSPPTTKPPPPPPPLLKVGVIDLPVVND